MEMGANQSFGAFASLPSFFFFIVMPEHDTARVFCGSLCVPVSQFSLCGSFWKPWYTEARQRLNSQIQRACSEHRRITVITGILSHLPYVIIFFTSYTA